VVNEVNSSLKGMWPIGMGREALGSRVIPVSTR